MRQQLRGGRILDLRGHNDEADILLKVTSAPEVLYLEYVKTKLGIFSKFFEMVFVRPFVLGAVLKALEVLTERVAFGFSWLRVLFVDYEVWSSDADPYYDRTLFSVQRIDSKAVASTQILSKTPEDSERRDTQTTRLSNREPLGMSLIEIKNEIAAQISLRHSAYYQDSKIIDRVAEFLAGKQEETQEPKAARTWPHDAFWEYGAALSVIIVCLNSGLIPIDGVRVHDRFEIFSVIAATLVNLWLFTRLTWNRMPRWQPLLRWMIWLALSLIYIWLFFFSSMPTDGKTAG
jgi:hypothetical protein